MAFKESTYNIAENSKNVVYTPDTLVENMLSLVNIEADRIDSRVLEPSCGDGNFLAAILNRKIKTLISSNLSSRIEYEFALCRIAMSLYGVDIDIEAVRLCRKRLYNIIKKCYLEKYNENQWDSFSAIISFILETNIIHGDALSLTSPISGEPIIFAEWSFLTGFKVKRRDFIYEHLINEDSNSDRVISDTNIKSFIPKPVKDYPLCKFQNIIQNGNI